MRLSTALQVAKGGFLIARHATMTPKSGPIGTPITITYAGLGSSLYEGPAALYYDNKFAGADDGELDTWCRWCQIRASGPVGKHVIDLDDAVTFGYMNIPQSPNPLGRQQEVHLHRDEGRRPTRRTDRLAARLDADHVPDDDPQRREVDRGGPRRQPRR